MHNIKGILDDVERSGEKAFSNVKEGIIGRSSVVAIAESGSSQQKALRKPGYGVPRGSTSKYAR